MAQTGLLDMIGRVLFWRFSRGSWQYDILCVFILAFIFLTPRSYFEGTHSTPAEGAEALEEVQVGGGVSATPAGHTGGLAENPDQQPR